MSHHSNQFLSKPEGKTLEFKQDMSSPKGVLKTLVAFANTAGGRLVIGITDDKKVIGLMLQLGAQSNSQPMDTDKRPSQKAMSKNLSGKQKNGPLKRPSQERNKRAQLKGPLKRPCQK
jgi:predicted HTH transcriptional regulator